METSATAVFTCVFGLIIFQLHPAVIIHCCTSDNPKHSQCFRHHWVHKVMFTCFYLLHYCPSLCGPDLNCGVFFSVRANPMVCIVIVVLVALYAVLLVFCNRADVQVEKNLGIFLLPDNNPSDQFLYAVTINTGLRSRARMTAKVLTKACVRLWKWNIFSIVSKYSQVQRFASKSQKLIQFFNCYFNKFLPIWSFQWPIPSARSPLSYDSYQLGGVKSNLCFLQDTWRQSTASFWAAADVRHGATLGGKR